MLIASFIIKTPIKAHVGYIKILTSLRGFLVMFLDLVWFSLYSITQVSFGNCETMESIGNFDPQASESC